MIDKNNLHYGIIKDDGTIEPLQKLGTKNIEIERELPDNYDMDNKIRYLESMGYWVKVKKPDIVVILKTGEINFNAQMSIESFNSSIYTPEHMISLVNKEIKKYLK